MTATGDPEVRAIAAIERALRPLNEQMQSRICDWIRQRYRMDNVYLTCSAIDAQKILELEERLAELNETAAEMTDGEK